MKWKLKFNQPVNNKENRIKEILRKSDPTDQEQIEVVEWFKKHRAEDFAKAWEKTIEVEKTE